MTDLNSLQMQLMIQDRINGLLEEVDRLTKERDEAVTTVARLRTALSDLLLSADASWEESNGGHDWPEACEAARVVLFSSETVTND